MTFDEALAGPRVVHGPAPWSGVPLPEVRKVVAALLFVLTGASLLLGSVFLAEIWGDGDSADSAYIEGALILLAVALVAAAAGAWTLRSR